MLQFRKPFHLILPGIAAALSSCSGTTDDHKPNIIVILADDMGWGDVKSNGNTFIETPTLDRLAKQSMSFDRFYVCPLSAPTRAEMLTGRYFLRTGVSSVTRGYENMRTDEVTIAEILKENGYVTGCFGKWHNGAYYQQHPNRQGFDEYVGFCMGHLGYYFDAFYLNNDNEVKSTGYASDYFTDMALDFIGRNKDKPFLCYVPYNVPHSPFQVPEKYFNKYNSAGLDSTLSSVYGMVENMDDNIDRIIKKIDDLGIADNTIIVFFSDNGPNTARFNGDMKGRKGSVDEGGIRVPFYIKWPSGIKPGTTTQLAQDIDILPTLLGLVGIDYTSEKPLDGVDLSGIISGKMENFDRYIFSRQGNQQIENCNSSVRNDRYRLVMTRKDTILYDLLEDPSQTKDISLENRETFRSMTSLLAELNQELVSSYQPVTTITAGFPEEKQFILPVQDAILSGKIQYSSIHPNQSHTEGWEMAGDSIYWNLNINTKGKYLVDLQYGCPEETIGSEFILKSNSGISSFLINTPYESVILPEMDFVKRSESVERTWAWMNAGSIELDKGSEQIVLKLIKPALKDAGLIKAIRLTRLKN